MSKDSSRTRKGNFKRIIFVQSREKLEGTSDEYRNENSGKDAECGESLDCSVRKIAYAEQFATIDAAERPGAECGDGCRSPSVTDANIANDGSRDVRNSDGSPEDRSAGRNRFARNGSDAGCDQNRRRKGGRRGERRRGPRKRQRRKGFLIRDQLNESDLDSGPDVGLNGTPERQQPLRDNPEEKKAENRPPPTSKFDRKTYQPERSERSRSPPREQRRQSYSDHSDSGPGLGGGGLGNGGLFAGGPSNDRLGSSSGGLGQPKQPSSRKLQRSKNRERKSHHRRAKADPSNSASRLPRQFLNVSERFLERALKLILDFVKNASMKELRFDAKLTHDEQNIIFNFFNSKPKYMAKHLSEDSRVIYNTIIDLGNSDPLKCALETVWVKIAGRRRGGGGTRKILTLVKPDKNLIPSGAVDVNTLRMGKHFTGEDSQEVDRLSEISSDSDSRYRRSRSRDGRDIYRRNRPSAKDSTQDETQSPEKTDTDLDEDNIPRTPQHPATKEKWDSEEEKLSSKDDSNKRTQSSRDPLSKYPTVSLKEGLSKKVESNIASRMMELMGWEGGALGRNGEGIMEPLQPNLELGKRKGLGHTEEPNEPRRRERRERKERREARKGKKETQSRRPKGVFRLSVLQLFLDFIRAEERFQLIFEIGLTDDERHFIVNLIEMVNKDKKFSPLCAEEMHLFDDIMAWKDASGYRTSNIGSNRQLVIMKHSSRVTSVLTPAELNIGNAANKLDLATMTFKEKFLKHMVTFVEDPEKLELKIGGGFTSLEKMTLNTYMSDARRASQLRTDEDLDLYKKIFQNERHKLIIEKCTSKKDTTWLWLVRKSETTKKNIMTVTLSDI